MTADLSALIARLEAAEFGGFGFDSEVFIALNLTQPRLDGLASTTHPPITTSLDAALALAERVLPGWVYMLVNDYGGYYRAELVRPESSAIACTAETMPLALCIAILKAKQEPEL